MLCQLKAGVLIDKEVINKAYEALNITKFVRFLLPASEITNVGQSRRGFWR
jgi:hypothetical protein